MWQQAELFRETFRTAEDAQRLLSAPGRPVGVVVTRNKAVMISIRSRNGHAEVRMVREFLAAPDEVWHALKLFLATRRRKAWRKVLEYVRTIEPRRDERPRTTQSKNIHLGKVYDLDSISRIINLRYFSGRLKCRVIWGRPAPQRRGARRSVRYGSYVRATGTVRINPLLDDSRVPREFLEYIVYHEMLHDAVPPETGNGRHIIHTRNFKRLEKQFPEYAKMRELSRELIGILNAR